MTPDNLTDEMVEKLAAEQRYLIVNCFDAQNDTAWSLDMDDAFKSLPELCEPVEFGWRLTSAGQTVRMRIEELSNG